MASKTTLTLLARFFLISPRLTPILAVVIFAIGFNFDAARGASITLIPCSGEITLGGVSNDGSLLTARSYGPRAPFGGYGYLGFLWTPTSGFKILGDAVTNSIAADGSVFYGWKNDIFPSPPIRWSRDGKGTSLGLPTGYNVAGAFGASADGQTVMIETGSSSKGIINVGGYGSQFYRWTSAGGIVPLGFGDGYGTGVSADASVVVGDLVGHGAFRWTQATGAIELGALNSGDTSRAHGVSGDGAVVVGGSGGSYAYYATGEAFRWTEATGMVDLGPGEAFGISQDGSVIVGNQPANNFGTETGFYWTAAEGMRSIEDVLEQDYAMDLTGWHLQQAHVISPNGQVIAGFGYSPTNYGIWVVNLAVPEPPGLALAALGMFLLGFRFKIKQSAKNLALFYARATSTMSRGRLTAIVFLVFALAVSSAVAANSRQNLLANADAEQGVYLGQDQYFPTFGFFSTPGWGVLSGDFRASAYADGNAVTINASTPGPSDEGKLNFFGGNAPLSAAGQLVSLSSFSSPIAAGTAQFTLAGWLGGLSTQNDLALLSVQFQDSIGNAVGPLMRIGPVTEADRGGLSSLSHRALTGNVPVGSTYALVTLRLIRFDGTTNNGTADDLVFSITNPGAVLITGDLNFDGHINALDIRAIMDALGDQLSFMSDYNLTPSNFSTVADVNHDSKITNADLQALLNKVKTGGGSTSVPEPSTFVLLSMGMLALRLKVRLRPSSSPSTCAAKPPRYRPNILPTDPVTSGEGPIANHVFLYTGVPGNGGTMSIWERLENCST